MAPSLGCLSRRPLRIAVDIGMDQTCMLSILQCTTGCVTKLLTMAHEEYFASATPEHTKCHRTVTIFFLVAVVPGRLLQSWPSTRIVHESSASTRRLQMKLMWPLWHSGFMVSHKTNSTANTFGPCGNRPWKSPRVGPLPPLPVLTPRGVHQYESCGLPASSVPTYLHVSFSCCFCGV